MKVSMKMPFVLLLLENVILKTEHHARDGFLFVLWFIISTFTLYFFMFFFTSFSVSVINLLRFLLLSYIWSYLFAFCVLFFLVIFPHFPEIDFLFCFIFSHLLSSLLPSSVLSYISSCLLKFWPISFIPPSWIPWNLSFRYINCTGQFTPKMKANAEPCLLSTLVWIGTGVVVSQHPLESFFMK